MVEYRGVTPKGSGYQAQVAGAGGYLGWRPTKRQAALLVAKKEKVTLTEVIKHQKQKGKMRPLRTHKWIYWLVTSQVWQVKLPNHQSFTAPTLHEAVEQAGKILKKKPESFKLLAPHAQDHGRDATKGQIGHVFRIVWGAYQQGPKQDGKQFACLPADAAYTYKYLRGPKAKPAEDPGTVFHYMMAKDGPGKNAVADATLKIKPKHGKLSLAELEELDYNRLAHSAQHLSKNYNEEEQAQWNKGPGKGTAHKMGLAMWLKRNLNMLQPCRGQGSFPIGKDRQLHKIKPLTKALRSKLRKTRAYGEALLKTKSCKLTFLKDWDKATKTLAKAAKGVPGLSGGQASYFFRWSTRQWLDRLMRLRHNWKGLRYSPKTSVWHLTKSFPDQSGHLAKLSGGRMTSMTIKKLRKALGYDAPIEHLTMHTCLCLTPQIRQMMHAAISKIKVPLNTKREKDCIKKLQKVRKANTKKSKDGLPIAPHPAVTVAKGWQSLGS